MAKTQIMISFDNGKWMCDFITVDKDHTQKEAIEAYMKQYEQVRNNMEIVSKLLPSIIHISIMGE
jgi:hypothetical protein